MNVSLDGYIAAPGDDLGWGVPSDELFQWWSDRVGATGLALYGRRLWETMSSHWPTADQQPGVTPAHLEFAHRWRDMPKVVFSSTISAAHWNTRLVTGDAVTETSRLKTEDGGPMDIGGATLAAAAMRAGLIDEYAIVTHPVLVGGGTRFFTALDNWVNLNLVETRTFPNGVHLTRYETSADHPTSDPRRALATQRSPVATRHRRSGDAKRSTQRWSRTEPSSPHPIDGERRPRWIALGADAVKIEDLNRRKAAELPVATPSTRPASPRP